MIAKPMDSPLQSNVDTSACLALICVTLSLWITCGLPVHILLISLSTALASSL